MRSGDLVEIGLRVVGERHLPGVNLQDFAAAGDVGRPDEDLAVEPAGPAERRIDGVDAVGGADDDHGVDALQPVHEREQLRHRAGVGMGAGLAALGRHGVELVDEDDRRRVMAGLVEHAAQVGFGLAGIGADHVGAVDVVEARVDLVGDRARQMRFAGAGRAIEDEPARRIDAEMAVDLRVRERKLHQFADQLDLLVQAADVLEGDIERAVRHVRIVILERDLGGVADNARTVGDVLDLVGRAGVRFGEGDVEHRADRDRRARLAQHLLDVRHEVVRHRDVDRGVELDALDRLGVGRLDVDGFVEVRLERLPHEAIEPYGAGAAVGLHGRIEPHQHAAAAVGRQADDRVGGDAQRRHQGGVQADRQPRALPGITGEMIDGGVNVEATAVAVSAVLVRAVVHWSSAGIPAHPPVARSRSRGRRRCTRSSSARWRRISP